MDEKKYQVFQISLDKNDPKNDKKRMVILRGGINQENPKKFMDDVVSKYVEGELYNEFIEVFLDNPWVRVLIFGINELNYEELSFDKDSILDKTKL